MNELFGWILAFGLAGGAMAQPAFETDELATDAGPLTMTFIGHGTLMFAWNGRIVHVDPYGKLADYSALPKADLLLITHDHADHLDPATLQAVRTPRTVVVVSTVCEGKVAGSVTLRNGERRTELGIGLEAVPAYNLVHKRPDGAPYHVRGAGNGYILTFGKTRVYVAGDTEGTPEMKALREIDVAFLPMNLPYTMTPAMVAEAARAFRPKLLYPYHYGDTDPALLADLLKDAPGIEVRIRRLR